MKLTSKIKITPVSFYLYCAEPKKKVNLEGLKLLEIRKKFNL